MIAPQHDCHTASGFAWSPFMEEADPTTLAGRTKIARLEMGLKQRELAALAGVQPMAISEIERGVTQSPKPETLARIAQVTKRSLEWFMRGDETRIDATGEVDFVPLAAEELLEKALKSLEVPVRFHARIRAFRRSKGPARSMNTVRTMIDELVAGYVAEEDRAKGVAFPKGGRESEAMVFPDDE
jgi:transcriptional regulator with XRE-family HTH domain